MFNKKHKALLFGVNDCIIKLVQYERVGPIQRRMVKDFGTFRFILNDDGTVSGSTTYDRWEPAS